MRGISDHLAGNDLSSAFAEVFGNQILCADDCFREISLEAAFGQEQSVSDRQKLGAERPL
jgi:hypothetical protein